MATIKEDATLIDMATIMKQQEHLKGLIEGKISTIASLITVEDEEESSKNKVLVVNPSRISVINSPFYVSMNLQK
jgi:hypothetical protein